MPACNMMRILLLAAAALWAAACGGPKNYNIMERKGDAQPLPVRIGVTDFEDLRENSEEWNTGFTYIPIIGLWGNWHSDRHDGSRGNITEPFPRVFAKQLADRMAEAGVAQASAYYAPDATPEIGTNDVVVKGTVHAARAKGGTTLYGLSFIGEWIQMLGIPYCTRMWEIDVELQLANAYTGAPIGEPSRVKFTTNRRFFNLYQDFNRVEDLNEKITPLYDQFIDHIWTQLPKSDDVAWANLKAEGEEIVAKARREAEFARKGNPPTFALLEPAKGSALRGATGTIRWTATAPGGLKSIRMQLNGRGIDTGIDTDTLAVADAAPRSVPATEMTIPLAMGENTLVVSMSDHRGNDIKETATITRLPAALVPANRYALLLGGAEQSASVEAVNGVLIDPYLGQFNAANVSVVGGKPLTKDDVEAAVSAFGSRPVSGDLAVIYLSTTGTWADRKIGDGSLTLDDFAGILATNLATGDVLLVLDIAWSDDPQSAPVIATLKDMPPQWAIAVPQAVAARPNGPGGLTPVAAGIVGAFKEGKGRLSLERFLDELVSRWTGKLETAGRYNTSITLAERE